MSNSTKGIPLNLQNVKEIVRTDTGEVYYQGKLSNLFVTVKSASVSVKGSLSVYHLGSNIQTLTRDETAYGIERLSDDLHLDMADGSVSRIDFGTNFPLSQPIRSYLPLLSALTYHYRNEFGPEKYRSIAFQNTLRKIKFYDKVAEAKSKRKIIPDEWNHLNIGRYEASFLYPGRDFQVLHITAKMLYDPVFFTRLIERWQELYFKIVKINKMKMVDEIPLKGAQDLNRLGLTLLSQTDDLYSLIMEELSRRNLTKSQRSRLRSKLRQSRTNRTITIPDERILELDQRVKEAVDKYKQ